MTTLGNFTPEELSEFGLTEQDIKFQEAFLRNYTTQSTITDMLLDIPETRRAALTQYETKRELHNAGLNEHGLYISNNNEA